MQCTNGGTKKESDNLAWPSEGFYHVSGPGVVMIQKPGNTAGDCFASCHQGGLTCIDSFSTGLIVLLATLSFASADAPTLQPGKSTTDDVLDALQASGKDLKTFTADVQMKIEDEVMSTSSTQIGKSWFKTDPTGVAQLHLIFDQKMDHGKPVPQKKLEYLLDGGRLTIRDQAKMHETRVQLVPPGQKMNLFQTG